MITEYTESIIKSYTETRCVVSIYILPLLKQIIIKDQGQSYNSRHLLQFIHLLVWYKKLCNKFLVHIKFPNCLRNWKMIWWGWCWLDEVWNQYQWVTHCHFRPCGQNIMVIDHINFDHIDFWSYDRMNLKQINIWSDLNKKSFYQIRWWDKAWYHIMSHYFPYCGQTR